MLLGLILSDSYGETPETTNTICFTPEIAKELIIEIKTCRDTDFRLTKLKLNYDMERNASDEILLNLTKQLSLMEEQVQDEHDRGEKYRLEWKDCGQAFTKCQQSKPSRATWFGAGYGSALITALIILAL